MDDKKLRVWWIPQVPMKPFTVDVKSVEDGVKIMEVLAHYDLFQLKNNIKPDYCNGGGLSMFDPDDDQDSPDGSWVGWYFDDGKEYFDDPREYLQYKEDSWFKTNNGEVQ
jgi:hypothetical protein